MYTYDRLGELTGTSGAGQLGSSYTYDPVGNRLTATQGSVRTASVYDGADWLTAVGALAAAYHT